MISEAVDRSGLKWDISWGVVDPEQALIHHFDLSLDNLKPTTEAAVFTDPQHKDEEKTLRIYKTSLADNVILCVMSEISPGIYALGVQKVNPQ